MSRSEMIIKDTQGPSGHWYCPETGKACHTVPNKSKPGTFRPTTISDARKGSLLPSVTGILSVIAKPQLVLWLQEQAILAALTLPRERGEIDDAFAARVVQDSKAQVRDAADRGATLHGIAEYYLTYGKVNTTKEYHILFEPLKDWIDKNVQEVIFAERVLVNKEQGYAGTCDLICRIRDVGLAIVDLKGQKYREDTKGMFAPLFYNEWPLQLMAYRRCLGEKEVNLISLPFCYEKPVQLVHKLWPAEDHETYWEAFRAAHTLWKYVKKW